ncbi:DUF3139 domain-containing protein [Sporolactobacillus pectinivorans]|uniref:DUF3139 domain-containing protein n=1 Tax=Sporolactobacillus pectinivorans TaxID=1591408 RepID=UPI000C25D1E7|nr:DUF3139 domain-containing protein [Sporolactobacillus pectinivorans]
MNKNRLLIITLIALIIIILGCLGYYSYRQQKREVAWSTINHYITKQGIAKKDIEVSSFGTENDGQYHRFIYVKEEKPNIAYEYIYKSDINQVYFSAEYVDRKSILQHEWGGTELLSSEMRTIKFHPLKNSYGYGSKYDINP